MSDDYDISKDVQREDGKVKKVVLSISGASYTFIPHPNGEREIFKLDGPWGFQ